MSTKSKSDDTLLILEAAKQRILEGKPKRISLSRKLNVRSCEEEAGLGNGTAYYYPEFVLGMKNEKTNQTKKRGAGPPASEIERLKSNIKRERQIKNNHRKQLAAARGKLKKMAKEHTQMTDALISCHSKIGELKIALVEEKQRSITRIK